MSEAPEVQTEAAPEIVAPAPSQPAPVAASAGPRAAVLAGPGALPVGYDFVVVAEGRVYGESGSSAALSGYPAGAALYLRTEAEVAFPDGSTVLTLGVDVAQNGFAGFAAEPGLVNVGPCHPAYAAANLAFQHGAASIDILGLADGEKERLKPWFDTLPDTAEPAQVAVSLI